MAAAAADCAAEAAAEAADAHLFDESTVPLIDIASSISSNEEVATTENENFASACNRTE